MVNIPSYSSHLIKDEDVNEINFSISRLFEILDYIDKFTLTGGEPFLNSDLDQIIEYVMKFESKFNILEISTNGTIIPTRKLQNVLKKHNSKLFVLIDYYGDLSCNAIELAEKLKSINVKHIIRNYTANSPYKGGWVDFGDLTSEIYSIDEVHKHFLRCVYSKRITLSVLKGKIFPCCRVRVYNDFISQVDKHLHIDLYSEESLSEKRSKLISLLKMPHWEICRYCYGMTPDSKRINPAIQVTK